MMPVAPTAMRVATTTVFGGKTLVADFATASAVMCSELEAVVAGVQEHHPFRAPALGENQHRSFRLEHTAGQRQHRLHPVVLHQDAAQLLVGAGRAEQHPFRHNHAAASVRFQIIDHVFDEQKLGRGRRADLHVIDDAVAVDAAGKGRIGEHHVSAASDPAINRYVQRVAPQLPGCLASNKVVLAEDCLDLAKMSLLAFIAKPDFFTVREKNKRHAKLIGVASALRFPATQIDARAFGFEHGQRAALTIKQGVISFPAVVEWVFETNAGGQSTRLCSPPSCANIRRRQTQSRSPSSNLSRRGRAKAQSAPSRFWMRPRDLITNRLDKMVKDIDEICRRAIQKAAK